MFRKDVPVAYYTVQKPAQKPAALNKMQPKKPQPTNSKIFPQLRIENSSIGRENRPTGNTAQNSAVTPVSTTVVKRKKQKKRSKRSHCCRYLCFFRTYSMLKSSVFCYCMH